MTEAEILASYVREALPRNVHFVAWPWFFPAVTPPDHVLLPLIDENPDRVCLLFTQRYVNGAGPQRAKYVFGSRSPQTWTAPQTPIQDPSTDGSAIWQEFRPLMIFPAPIDPVSVLMTIVSPAAQGVIFEGVRA